MRYNIEYINQRKTNKMNKEIRTKPIRLSADRINKWFNLFWLETTGSIESSLE